ncbi:MAG: GntR family transcriptional regulator [Actinobacteria bacterium]|nr:GntR family transcriptional regulator [Actinomycetota bacterium]
MAEAGLDDSGAIGPTAEDARRRLVGMVERGTLRPGQRLGAERELAVKLGVSRSTLRQALGALEEAGVVRRVPGRGGGTFIASPKVERDLSRIVGIPMLLRDQGFTAGSRVLSVAVRTAGPEAARALGIAEDEFVVDLVRIRLADGVPISLEQAVFPAELVPGLPERALGGSIYELCDSEYGLRPDEAIEHIEVVLASSDEAAVLGIDRGDPLLLVTRTTRTAAGVAFEFSRDLFRADRTRISVKVKGSPANEKARLRGRIVELVPPAE